MNRAARAQSKNLSCKHQELVIVRFAGDWRLYRNGMDAGRFNYKVDAVEAALRLAANSRSRGITVDVQVQDAAGQLSSYFDC